MTVYIQLAHSPDTLALFVYISIRRERSDRLAECDHMREKVDLARNDAEDQLYQDQEITGSTSRQTQLLKEYAHKK